MQHLSNEQPQISATYSRDPTKNLNAKVKNASLTHASLTRSPKNRVDKKQIHVDNMKTGGVPGVAAAHIAVMTALQRRQSEIGRAHV